VGVVTRWSDVDPLSKAVLLFINPRLPTGTAYMSSPDYDAFIPFCPVLKYFTTFKNILSATKHKLARSTPSKEITAIKNKAVVDRRLRPRCCHLIRLQEVVPCVRCLQRVFIRAVYSQASARELRLSWEATSSSLGLCANMTSPIKPKVGLRNISLHRQKRTESRL